MFQSFTGTARRPRQVNLSGRHSATSAGAASGRDTLVNAQQERFQRQLERAKQNSAKLIERRWRGYAARKQLRQDWRRSFDTVEEEETGWKPGFHEDASRNSIRFQTEEDCCNRIALLLLFLDITSGEDLLRLRWLVQRVGVTITAGHDGQFGTRWRLLLLRLARASLRVLMRTPSTVPAPDNLAQNLIALLLLTTKTIPDESLSFAEDYYRVLSSVTDAENHWGNQKISEDMVLLAALSPLNTQSPLAYASFIIYYLTTVDLPWHIPSFDTLCATLDKRSLGKSLAQILKNESTNPEYSRLADRERRTWLLAYFIHIHRLDTDALLSARKNPDRNYITAVSLLLCSLADEISGRIDLEDDSMEQVPDGSPEDLKNGKGRGRLEPTRTGEARPLSTFVRQEILSLVNQEHVTSLLGHVSALPHMPERGPSSATYKDAHEEASLLAGYVLTLLRVFPRRGDELRMWLYLGSASADSQSNSSVQSRQPAIKYFWGAAKRSAIFRSISADYRSALDLLSSTSHGNNFRNDTRPKGGRSTPSPNADEWQIILLFLELYMFVLKVMDDEEFFAGGDSRQNRSVVVSSWTRENALSLGDVKDLTTFLKNLAFTMYWNASDILGTGGSEQEKSISRYFNRNELSKALDREATTEALQPHEISVGGIAGLTLDYLKGIVTGLLRMVYERDSRRRFLPTDHWLMTSCVDMDGFIPAVVSEEENRQQVQDEDDEDEEQNMVQDAEGDAARGGRLVGTGTVLRNRNIELLKREQRKASRKRFLEAVTPRLEILQNMPFFIPFETRVKIFREFVLLDKTRRRRGHVDPDNWRVFMMQSPPSPDDMFSGRNEILKHHAKIRRGSVFEDAYEQFYGLGEGLKEPIQITFVDQFGTIEAGIDGGGVTKEFLTSVTMEAFSASNGYDLFVENDQRLLYPNPAAVDERKQALKDAGVPEGSAEWKEQIRDLLKRYEFLGRIMGKCLYEGILVDVAFAGFFLLKWALTGSYRANVNDLRDLDEGLYQGLLQLKNYPGDVEDFALNFTVTDTLPSISGPGRTITRELKPNGSNIPVTNENRLVYISYIARHRLQVQPFQQTNAFLKGLSSVIQPSWLSMFNQSELQTLVGGDACEIDVDDLRRNTQYGGVYVIGDDLQEHPTVKLFWEVMRSLSDEDRRKVLKFVTSTPRGPLLGFSQLNPKFSIRDSGEDRERLPSTSTCVNLLKLPRYSSASVLRDKLLYAVNSGAGFDLS